MYIGWVVIVYIVCMCDCLIIITNIMLYLFLMYVCMYVCMYVYRYVSRIGRMYGLLARFTFQDTLLKDIEYISMQL